ncbi:unnamed protein product [Microthlaspi erraticum]|jgi:hypothetical protein|uniref:Uncharacterized protein n=1 Tax=Microthlaspi erraticum TaxID=1685480 RepID=A0A6D2J4T9_9BRAS|nr:unnamed protein product [Microthlaspi erraticum]CAA7035929.1 unnamed protein product [Microthlaspi erraticum]CAA7035934.1 unnamed protein product [Microthlaspi erraticum]
MDAASKSSPDPSSSDHSAIVSPDSEKLPTLEQMIAEVSELDDHEDDGGAAKNYIDDGEKKQEPALQDEAEEMMYRLELTMTMTEDISDYNVKALSRAMKAIEEAVKNLRKRLESAEILIEKIEKSVFP